MYNSYDGPSMEHDGPTAGIGARTTSLHTRRGFRSTNGRDQDDRSSSGVDYQQGLMLDEAGDENSKQGPKQNIFRKGIDFVASIPSRLAGDNKATGINLGDGGVVNIEKGNINVQAGTSAAVQENLKCTQIRVTQPKAPTGEYMEGVILEWSLPNPKHCEIHRLSVLIRDNYCGSVFYKDLGKKISEVTIPKNKLQCGSKFYAAVTSYVRYNGTEERHRSDDMEFETPPGRPSKINVTVNAELVMVQWSPCKGAEKFHVTLSDEKGYTTLDSKETLGSHHDCKFKIDSSRQIRLGKYYMLEVVAIKGQWENRSSEKCFLGEKNSPKLIKASLIAGTNKVQLNWEAPSWGAIGTLLKSYTYAVEVIAESGESRKMQKTNATRMEIGDLKGGMSYYFRVATVDGDSNSLFSTSNTIKTEACSIQVEKFRLQRSDEDPCSLECVWDIVESATGYKIRYKSSDKTCVVTAHGGASKYTIQNLLPNTKCIAAIKAKDEKGYGPYTDEEGESTGFGKPKDGQIEVANRNEIIVKFSEDPSASFHKIILCSSNGEEPEVKIKKGVQEKTFSDLLHNTEYHAKIISYYGDEEGGQTVTKPVMTAPSAPQQETIEWEPVKCNLTSAFTISVKVDENCTEYRARIKHLHSEDEDVTMGMVMTEGNERASLRYKCYYLGSRYGVMLQARNSGGYSDWSKQKIIVMAPRRIDSLSMELDGGNVIVNWKNVRHTKNNVLKLFEVIPDGTPEEVDKMEPKKGPYAFEYEVQHGIQYFCEIFPQNDTGRGPVTRSNTVLIPLDPPKLLRLTDEKEHVKLTWTPSTGMTSALVTVRDSESFATEYVAHREGEWKSHPVTRDEIYVFEVRARNGKILSKKFLEEIFVTAPSDIDVTHNNAEPETCLNVEIISKHTGAFLLSWTDNNGKKAEKKISGPSFTVKKLKPATEYIVTAECLYGENRRSQPCQVLPILTLPAKVTGVKSQQKKDSTTKTLTWDSCGNTSVKYTINWSRNHDFYKPITTYNTTWDFENMVPGSYEFYVSAGGGKKSEKCFVRVLDVPVVELMVVNAKHIQLTCSKVLHADEYVLQLCPVSDNKLPADDWPKVFRSHDTEFWIDYDFVCGEKYLATVRASWNGYLSADTKEYFYADLPAPMDLQYWLDKESPISMAYFKWSKSSKRKRTSIKLVNSLNQVVKEAKVEENVWEYGELQPNQEYQLKLNSGDGFKFYDSQSVINFRTAPTAPERVEVRTNEEDPTTKMDINIFTDYEGPFEILTVDSDGNQTITEINNKSVTIENLVPDEPYKFYVRCKFTDEANGTTFSSELIPAVQKADQTSPD